MPEKSSAAGDAPADKKSKDKEKKKEEPAKKDEGKKDPKEKPKDKADKGKKDPHHHEVDEPPSVHASPSQIAREEAEYRAQMRKQQLRKRHWPEVTKVKVTTKPWSPPGPPEKMPKVIIELPELELRKWVPPFMRRRRKRKRLPRILPEVQPMYENSKLRKIWHSFIQIDKNKMMIQGTLGCNSKKYSATSCGSQTGCIALVARALLEAKTPAQLVKQDVDDVIRQGDKFYKQCMVAMKCYKGKPQLNLGQLLPSFYLHDVKYTVKLEEIETGLLAKHPDNVNGGADLMAMMEKRIGQTYIMVMSVGTRHFLIWGHPPEAGGNVKTICYIFDPHMLDEVGEPIKLPVTPDCCVPKFGAGAFLRYPGVVSFVIDFLNGYGNLGSAGKYAKGPTITLTNVDVVQKEPLLRNPGYELDLKALKWHCKSEWDCWNQNVIIDQKLYKGKYPAGSLSAASLATSRMSSRRKVLNYYQKGTAAAAATPDPGHIPPVPPEKPPPEPTMDQIMQLRGENFFLNPPLRDAHTYGRDELLPFPKSETIIHSPVEIMDRNFQSQFTQLDVEMWILRGTRHFASYRYQTFKTFTGVACCVVALATCRRLRARGWNEDTIDETLDLGYNYYRESVLDRGGPIRRIVLGELKETLTLRDKEYKQRQRGVAFWGKLISNNPKVFDLCRGIEAFFKEADSGVLQIPGEYETAIWNEGGKYYVYHPWPADRYGTRVGLQDGGKACLLGFTRLSRLCEHFLDNVKHLRKKPFSIAEVGVYDLGERPEPVGNMKPVAPNRWVVRGSFHEADEKFPEDHRGKQATPTSIAAIAMAKLMDPAEWTPTDVDEVLTRGDILYEKTMEHLEKMGISFETPLKNDENEGEEEEVSAGTTGTLAAADVLPRFRISEYDCIEADVADSSYSGQLTAEPGSGVMSLKESLAAMFKDNKAAVLTARGGSLGIWKQDDYLYMFDPHGCDENGLPSDDRTAGAVLIRMKNDLKELTNVIMGNLAPGSDDSFNLSPVDITHSKLNVELGAPEQKLENKAFEWLKRGTAQLLMGSRGENSAIGKAATKAKIPPDDLAGRTLGLPAAAAFCAATDTCQPPGMHMDHMFNFLEAGGEYYKNHVKKTGRKEINVEDLGEKFEMGANTFSIEVGESIRLPLRLPDKPEEGGGEEEETGEKVLGEGEEAREEPMKEMKELLFKMWYDTTKPTTVSLLVGDYHQLGLWMAAEGKVVAFDPAPTLAKGLLTPQRIAKGDELRLQRMKDEQSGEGGEEAEDEELGGEGEAQPEPEPEFVPKESCPVLMVAATPGEFIDKLVEKGGLDAKQMVAPYWLYPVKVTNELTSLLKEKRPGEKGDEGEGEEEAEDVLIEPLGDAALGPYFLRMGRTVASVRGRLAQNEPYFLDEPNRDNQDAANAVMGIVAGHIEPYTFWKPSMVDGILKYGDRLYTMSLPDASAPPRLVPDEVKKEFHVTSFNVKLEVDGNAINGDVKAGESGSVQSLKKGLIKFFEKNQYGVLCAKDYCVGLWRAADNKAYCMWDPHPIGPTGKSSPGGAAGLVIYSTVDELSDTYKANLDVLARAGTNKYSISMVKVFWEYSRTSAPVTPQGAVPDEGYEWKVLTAYVEIARGRTILRGSRPPDLMKFTRDSLLQSSASAIVAACMTKARRPHLWTRKTVDDIMKIACHLFAASLNNLGYEFRPGEDLLMPLQVMKRFVLGVNYVRYNLESVYSGKLEQNKEPSEIHVRPALERFFEEHTHGILWSVPHAVAVWRVEGAPAYYMMEPHSCGSTGLRLDGVDEGAPCVMTFTSPKLMAFAYLQNIPLTERPKHEFTLYAMSIAIEGIKKLKSEPPLVVAPPGVALVPATSKVGVDGRKRRAAESDRKHPPGSTTCFDVQKLTEERDRDDVKYKGQRNSNGWLVLSDGTQYISAGHSIACKRFPYASRGNQAVATSVMAVAMSRVEDVCRWCSSTLNQILDSGDQLYQDSYLHFRPPTPILTVEQILRKFYTPGNCVTRVIIYQSRQQGKINVDLYDKMMDFFREEKAGIFVAGKGDFAVALFRTPRGFYMFDPADRDRYGRAVAPPCIGKARACFSQYPTVKSLAQKLKANVPPVAAEPPPLAAQTVDKTVTQGQSDQKDSAPVRFTEPASFSFYGMDVSSLRRLNQHEK